jgi:micrococcal nuclease
MYDYMATLIKVVDGDTVDCDIDLGFGVWLKNQRIRLYGINAPETRTKDLEEKKAGQAAKLRLIAMMSNKFLLTTVKDKKGKYGRILGTINVPVKKQLDKDGKKIKHIFVDINNKLVEEGHAKKVNY